MYCDTMTLSMTFRLVSSPCKFDSPSEPVGNPLARGPQKPEAWLLKYGLCFKISSRQLQTWSALQSDSRRIAEFSSIFINFPFVHWVRWALRHYATTLRRNASTPWSVARALTSTDTLHHSATAPVLQVAVLHQSKASKALRKALRYLSDQKSIYDIYIDLPEMSMSHQLGVVFRWPKPVKFPGETLRRSLASNSAGLIYTMSNWM